VGTTPDVIAGVGLADRPRKMVRMNWK